MPHVVAQPLDHLSAADEPHDRRRRELQRRQLLQPDRRVHFRGGGTVANPKYVENAAAIQALTKYWLFNAMAIYPLNQHIQLQVNATNLANEKYADRAYDRHFLPGPTRQILFSPVITF